MQYTTKTEREELIEHVHRYVQAGNTMSIRQHQRLMLWLAGNTCGNIAKREGVTRQAIAQSVRRDFKKVQEFALNKG